MKNLFFLFFIVGFTVSYPQKQVNDRKAKAMVFGIFHFSYPNLDRIKTDKKDQLNLTTPERQKEIEEIVHLLEKFKPTKIAVEIKTWSQLHIDSLYGKYLTNNYNLPINESYQIGFRLAKILNHSKIYCVDTWGNISEYFTGNSRDQFNIRTEKEPMLNKYEAFTDSVTSATKKSGTTEGETREKGYKTLQKILSQINAPEKIKKDNARYLNELSLFEEKEFDYAGTDWIAASWYNRNLRIFRNIQRITENSTDRILIIYGSGHAYLLSQFLDNSLKYDVVPVLNYIKE